MRNLLIVFLVLGIAQTSLGQLSGPLSGTLGPGEFHIIGNISVAAGDTLRLMPGTTFHFDGPYPLEIYGTLLAEGVQSHPITFTTDTVANADRWRGLKFYYSGSSISQLAYCLIQYSRLAGPPDWGGGIHCLDSSPTFDNCTLRANSAPHGGGIFCTDSSPSFTSCTIHGNSATAAPDGYGGGVYLKGNSSPIFTNCTITGNSARYGGGGAAIGTYSSPTFTHCIISSNEANNRGGGVYCARSSPCFRNCIISGNSASNYAGGVCSYDASPDFSSTIIAFSEGSGIHFWNSASSRVAYCDIFGNSDGNISFRNDDPLHGPLGIGHPDTVNTNGDSCDIHFNIFLNPMFADTIAGDFHLTHGSPCIDAGDPSLPLDPDSTVVDIGAFFFEQLTIIPSNLGFGNIQVRKDTALSLWVYNLRDSDIVIESVRTDDPAFIDNWSLADSILAPGDSLRITLTFTPDSSRDYAAVLNIETSFRDGIVPLSGTGLGAYLTVTPLEFNFGAVELGYPETLTVALANLGNILLSVSEIIACPPIYFVLPGVDTSVAPGATGWAEIVFDPPTPDLFTCVVTIASNAYNVDSAWVTLYGEGGPVPAPITDLTLVRSGIDVLLRWSPVDSTLHGNPVEVDYYIVYNSGIAQGPFWFSGYTDSSRFRHVGVIPFNSTQFYVVDAYAGPLQLLERAVGNGTILRDELRQRLSAKTD